jgi:pSer/pThr/pTyr-binding forkhead associated (FHA) protein
MSRHTLAGNGGTPWPVLKPLSQSLSRSIRIGRQVCIVGSHSRVHLPLHSPMVSRTHALIVVDGSDTFVRDLASRNGIYVNGIAMREGRLRHGDLLCIGPFAFWWSLGHPAGPRPRHLMADTDRAAKLHIADESEPRRMEGYSLVIGRRPDCDIVLDGILVEPVHAVLYRKNGQFHIRDLNSTMGTYVNNRRVRTAELRKGDEFRIGLSRIRFEPPEVAQLRATETSLNDTELIAGLAGSRRSDQPFFPPNLAARSCPTIEQLLCASTGRITHWQRAS